MPRTAIGWIGDYDPLKMAVHHSRDRVLVGVSHGSGVRFALDLPARSAGILAMLGAGDDDERSQVHESEVEIDGKLFVGPEHPEGEAGCEARLERWEGPTVPLRVGFEPQPRSLVLAVRDPAAAHGFVLKLPNRARNALFRAIMLPLPDQNPRAEGEGRIDGRLSVTL